MYEFLIPIIAFALSAVFATLVIPPLVRVVRAKNLFEPKDHRKQHNETIPTIGGVAIFLGFMISSFLATYHEQLAELRYLFPALLMMLFIGLKDDLITISARKKFLVQLFTAVMVVVLGKIRLTHMNGFLGIYELDLWISVPLSVIIIVAAINAFNLIDGIDGLASGISFLISIAFGACFWLLGHVEFTIIAFALAGSVAAFFRFNVFGKRYKLFMGDTGSLIIGTTLIIFSFKLIEHGKHMSGSLFSNYTLALVIAIQIFPLVDIIRVMTIRILQGRSPFSADRNHIHHHVLNISGSHLKATLKIFVANVLFIVFVVILTNLQVNINAIIMITVSLGFLLAYLPFRISEKRRKEEWKYNVYPD